MTDLEMLQACAVAIGHKIYHVTHVSVHTEEDGYYSPLENDAQAMALVKKIKLSVLSGECDDGDWMVTGGEKLGYFGKDADLNRAIVTCVAKFQESK